METWESIVRFERRPVLEEGLDGRHLVFYQCLCKKKMHIFLVNHCISFLWNLIFSPPHSHLFLVSGWKSIPRAVDQVPDAPPISDGGAVHDGGDAKWPSVEPHVHGKTLAPRFITFFLIHYLFILFGSYIARWAPIYQLNAAKHDRLIIIISDYLLFVPCRVFSSTKMPSHWEMCWPLIPIASSPCSSLPEQHQRFAPDLLPPPQQGWTYSFRPSK